jgi:hypothetical protein
VPVKPARLKRELTFIPHQRPELMTPEKGGAEHSTELFYTLQSSVVSPMCLS